MLIQPTICGICIGVDLGRKKLNYLICLQKSNSYTDIKTHSSVSVAKKTKDMWHTSVLFTGTVKLPNSAFCISKTTKSISTKFIYFLPYIYITSHTKIEGNHFSTS